MHIEVRETLSSFCLLWEPLHLNLRREIDYFEEQLQINQKELINLDPGFKHDQKCFIWRLPS
jgi:hypothetical protein